MGFRRRRFRRRRRRLKASLKVKKILDHPSDNFLF